MPLLREIADIKVGYTFRGKIQNEVNANTAIIQLKDINYDFNTINTPSTFIDSNKFKTHHFLQDGDILFIAKGLRQVAVTYIDKGSAIASSVFFIIRVKSNTVLPEYLTWFLNNRKTQTFFNRMKSGTSTLNITKDVLGKIKIEIPSMEIQNRIANYCNLCQKEYIIMDKLIEKKKAINEQLMLNLIN